MNNREQLSGNSGQLKCTNPLCEHGRVLHYPLGYTTCEKCNGHGVLKGSFNHGSQR